MLYFTAFEAMKHLCLSRGTSKPIAEGMAGAAGCLIGQSVVAPFSVVSTRLQLQRGVPMSVFSVVRSIHATNGGRLRSFWSTYPNAVAQIMPQNFVMWSTFSYTHALALSWEGCEEDPSRLSLGANLACSATASITAMFFTSPMDNIKTHKEALLSGTQSPSLSNDSGHARAPRTGPPTSWFVCKHIYHTQGVLGFFRGMVARGIATSPPIVAVLVGYQYVKAFSSQMNLEYGAS